MDPSNHFYIAKKFMDYMNEELVKLFFESQKQEKPQALKGIDIKRGIWRGTVKRDMINCSMIFLETLVYTNE